MTVYHKIVRIKPSDPQNPTKDVNKYLREHPGIDYIILGHSQALNQITLEFACSDNNPSQPRTIKDIDNMLMHFEVVKDVDREGEQLI